MRDIPLLFDEPVHFPTIIGLVQAQVLSGGRALDQDRADQCGHMPLLVVISPKYLDCQGSTALIHQDMDLATQFRPIGRIFPSTSTAQGRRNRAAIRRLPGPAHMPHSTVIADQGFQDVDKDRLLLPELKTSMNDTAGGSKLGFIDRLPLASRPQHIPDPIHDCSIAACRPSSSTRSCFRKVLLDLPPQLARYPSIVHILRFCARLTHDVPPFLVSFRDYLYNGVRLFFQPI